MTGPAPLVAILTPVYNGDAFIAGAMDAVQAQTHSNIVHIVVDNASTDRTREIVRSRMGGRIPVVPAFEDSFVAQRENWMRAIAATPPEARYFRILCADDLIDPGNIEDAVRAAEADPAIVVVGSGHRVEGQIGDTVISEVHPVKWPADRDVFDGDEAIGLFLRGKGTLVGPQLLYRRSLIEKMPDFFTDRAAGFDTEAALRALSFGKFATTRSISCTVRVQEESVSHLHMHRTHTHFVDWMIYLDTFGRRVLGEADYLALRREFRRYYLRRLVGWTASSRSRETIALHMRSLKAIGAAPRAVDWADSLLDLALRRAGLRRPTPSGHPLG